MLPPGRTDGLPTLTDGRSVQECEQHGQAAIEVDNLYNHTAKLMGITNARVA